MENQVILKAQKSNNSFAETARGPIPRVFAFGSPDKDRFDFGQIACIIAFGWFENKMSEKPN